MNCLILAAGYGTRLREVSDSKPLTPIEGVPLIEHVVAGAAKAGARDFLVVTGHEAVRVESFLATLPSRLGVGVEWIRCPNWDRPNGYSVLAAQGRMSGDYLLLMADHLFDPEIPSRLLDMPRSGVALRLAVDCDPHRPLIDLDDATKVELAADGAIVRIGKTLRRFDAVDTGIFLATPKLAEAIRADIEAGGGGSLSEGVQRLADPGLAQTMDIRSAEWIDVDDPERLRLAETLFAQSPSP